MIGAVIADMLSMKKVVKLYLIVSVIYIALGIFNGGGSGMVSFLVFFAVMLVLASFSYNDICHWDKFINVTPVRRIEIVAAKYIFALTAVAVSTLIGEIVLYVPQNENLRELNIETGAGKITIDGISSEKVEIDHGAGVLEISNSSFQNANIDGGAGKIAIHSSVLNNLNLDTGVRRVDIEAEITGRSEINSGIGEVNINILVNEEEYEIIAEKGLGNLKVKNQEQTANVYRYGSGNNVIEVEGGIGNININFINENNV